MRCTRCQLVLESGLCPNCHSFELNTEAGKEDARTEPLAFAHAGELKIPLYHDTSVVGLLNFKDSPMASIGNRAIALLIDYLVLSSILATIYQIIGINDRILFNPTKSGLMIVPLLHLVLTLFTVFFYFVTMTSWRGQTIGKILMKIKVVPQSREGQVTVNQAFFRYLGKVLSLLPLGYGFLAMLWSPLRQCWHDRLAGTVVISMKRG